ncbi:MAG: alpha/beta fold hydrolase [Actinomycetota bacterium]|nr:alpha/beta fold hydrolase [Actinomycetota bacterium]
MGECRLQVRSGALTFPVRTAGPDGGEPVILLHGFPQASATWSPYLARLSSARLRAIAPDQRGYAATARPTAVDQYSVDHLVADVLGIADGLGVDRFHLVGHDWGGIVGWALASSYPERLHGLTSVSVPHPRASSWSMWRSLQLARSWYVALFQIPQVPERLLTTRDAALLRRVLRSSGLPDADADAYADTMVQPGAMGRITVPALLVWSTNDIALSAPSGPGPPGERSTRRTASRCWRGPVTGSPRRASRS